MPRNAEHKDEIGTIWAKCGINSEWKNLKSVIIHTPGPEIDKISNPDNVQMLEIPNWENASKQHHAMAQIYHNLGVNLIYVNPEETTLPNLIFCADLVFMTPEGAILGRPASIIRAGEERWIARRLADLGIPILRSLQGDATFEGADAMWLDEETVLIGRGLRTNDKAIEQIDCILGEMGVDVIAVDLPIGTMHLMGVLRFLDRGLALIWPYRLAWRAVHALKNRGVETLFIPDEKEAVCNGALNFVTLGPRKVLMPEANPVTIRFLESLDVTCHTLDVKELQKAAGSVGCLTGIIERDMT